MKPNQPKIKVMASGKYIPPKIIDNQYFEEILDTTDEWITTRTGIKTRHKAVDETTSDMAYKAAMDAINHADYDKSKIDLIIVATVTSDQLTPTTANFVQAKLNLDHNVMSFNINAACTGFVYALEVAALMLQSNKFRAALIIGAETLTRVTDYTDRNTAILFGDGAGAMIIEPSHKPNNQAFFYNAAKSDTKEILTVIKHIKMVGKRVYQFAVSIMEESITKILKQSGLDIKDIDAIMPHQANERIIQSVANSTGIPISKFMINIQKYGNTSAASIPITVAEYFQEKNRKGKKILLVGFGGGFTWGSAILQL